MDPVWYLEPELIQKLTIVTDSNVRRLTCQSHNSHSHATLLIDVTPRSAEWDVVDFCCEDFRGQIAAGMPYPWNQPPGIRKFERATQDFSRKSLGSSPDLRPDYS